jgi:hypothetical protein
MGGDQDLTYRLLHRGRPVASLFGKALVCVIESLCGTVEQPVRIRAGIAPK